MEHQPTRRRRPASTSWGRTSTPEVVMSIAVGVDIGAYKHAVAVCRSGEREADRRTLQISANRAGFQQLAGWMGTLAEPVSLVVMESSGHYWFNLASHLHRAGIPVAVVNPLESKYFGKRRLQRSKSDKADARTHWQH